MPTSETVPGLGPQPDVEIMVPRVEEQREETEAEQQARVLARLQEMGSGGSKTED